MSDVSMNPVAPQPTQTTGASNDNVMAAVATIPLVGLIIYFAMPTAGDLVKFYAKQSIGLLILGIVIQVAAFVVGWIPFLGWVLGFFVMLLNLGLFIAWLVLVINALQGNRYRFPVLADLTDKFIK